MTPKHKAEELVLKFREVPIEDSLMWYVGYEISKEFALIAVDEILNHHSQEQGLYRIDTYYWQQVKKEIENL